MSYFVGPGPTRVAVRRHYELDAIRGFIVVRSLRQSLERPPGHS